MINRRNKAYILRFSFAWLYKVQIIGLYEIYEQFFVDLIKHLFYNLSIHPVQRRTIWKTKPKP